MNDEVLLTPEKNRNTLLPIRHEDIWHEYEKQEGNFWVVNEVNLLKDVSDWEKLSDNEKHFLKMVLAFFASSDLIVNENLAERFSREVQVLEAKFVYDFQKMMENIHSNMYSRLIDMYIKDQKEKEHLFNAVETVPIVAKKAQWAKKWIESNESFAQRLVAFSAVEGIFFSGSFCAIFWVGQRGILPGLIKSNEFISRDEGAHTDFAVLLHKKLKNKCPVDVLHDIIRDAVEIEKEFISDALPCSLIGMNAKDMKQYIEFVANRLVIQYGYPELFPGVKNPFAFMERISLKTKTNFFEKRPTEYSQSSMEKFEAEDPYADC
jgi:ribonucleoside-diphosphate reductase beta chain